MLSKQHFKQFADACAVIRDDEDREKVMVFLEEVCRSSNSRFDSGRFREWVRRVRAGEDLKGLR